MYRIIQKRKIWYTLSAIIIIPGIIAMLLGGINLGIDFTGGSLMRIDFTESDPELDQIEETISTVIGSDEVTAQPIGEGEYTVRFQNVTNETHQIILQKLASSHGTVEERSYESIGPTIGEELKDKAVIAIVLVLLFIIVYISIAFRKSSTKAVKSYVFGLGALVALFHDILIVIGVFAVIGYFTGQEIDILFITALLTVLGFSVHDTIVVYDRVREQVKRSEKKEFADIVNDSVNQTLIRSINTSVTTLLVLAALYLFGGGSIQYFVLALLVGIVAGTYSSVFIASPFLVTWHKIIQK